VAALDADILNLRLDSVYWRELFVQDEVAMAAAAGLVKEQLERIRLHCKPPFQSQAESDSIAVIEARRQLATHGHMQARTGAER
jgi:hypothetical protein